MTEFLHDVFISYSRRDKAEIEGIVKSLTETGLKVWWDRKIGPGDFPDQIERNLRSSRWVLAFLTTNVVSPKSTFVLSEMKLASDAGKLIPVRIGEFNIGLDYLNLTITLQTYSYGSFATCRTDEIAAVCGGTPQTQTRAAAAEPLTAAAWLETGPTLRQIAMAAALSALDGAPLSIVAVAADTLERHLDPPDPDNPPTRNERVATLLRSRSTALSAIGARAFVERHGRFGVPVEYVRFHDPNRALDLLGHIWDEMDGLRPVMLAWLDETARSGDPDVRRRLGLMIGALARRHFMGVFTPLIGRWCLDDDEATRDVADFALAIAGLDPTVEAAIKQIVADFSQSSRSRHLRAAVELACGNTGSRINGLAVETLKTVARAQATDFKVLDAMRRSVQFLLQNAAKSDDNSLFDLPRLVGDLARWAAEPDEGTPQRLPLALFLELMADLPLREPDDVGGSLSLDAIVAQKEMSQATAKVFVKALGDHGNAEIKPRDWAQGILRNWSQHILDQREARGPGVAVGAGGADAPVVDGEPLLALARDMHRLSPTDRDRKRLAFALRRVYSEPDLAFSPSV